MSKSSQLAHPRFSLPIPNEILYEILSDLLIEDLHARLMQELEKPDSAPWNALIVLPHVSRAFRATSIRICAMVFSLRLGKCGDWLLERVHGKLKYFKAAHIPPLGLDPAPEEELEHLDELESIFAGIHEEPQGVLRVYGSIVRSNLLRRGRMRLGFEYMGSDLERLTGTAKRLMVLLGEAQVWSSQLKPAKLASLASEAAIYHCATDILTFVFWTHSNLLNSMLPFDSVTRPLSAQVNFYLTTNLLMITHLISTQVVMPYLDIFESFESTILHKLIGYPTPQHRPQKTLLTRQVLEDSGVMTVLEKIRSNEDDDPYGLRIRVAKILEGWRCLL